MSLTLREGSKTFAVRGDTTVKWYLLGVRPKEMGKGEKGAVSVGEMEVEVLPSASELAAAIHMQEP